MLIEIKKRKQIAQLQLQKCDDKENVTANKIEERKLVDQTKGANKRTRGCKKQNDLAKLEKVHKAKDELKIHNNENAAVNVIAAKNPIDRTSKTKDEDESIEMTENKRKNKRKNQREKKTPHSTRYKPSINHMPGIDFKARVRCKFEDCELLSNCYCIECGVHLCIKSNPQNTQEGNCFLKYHTLPI